MMTIHLSWYRYSFPLTISSFLLFLSFSSLASAAYDPYSVAARCPLPCDEATSHTNWGQYQDIAQWVNCDKPILFDFNLYNGVNSSTQQVALRACSVQVSTLLTRRQSFSYTPASNSTKTTFDTQLQTQDIEITRWSGQSDDSSGTVIAAASALADAVRTGENGISTILFAKLGQVIIGVYAGFQIENEGLGEIILSLAQREANQNFKKLAAQLCSPDTLGSQVLGIFVDTTGDLMPAQAALRDWNEAKCINPGDETETWQSVSIPMVPGNSIAVGPDIDSNHVTKRATCSYTQSVSGDGCWALADRCKITQDQLVSYNNDPNLCSNLQIGQYVCCSPGTLPDFTPQPNADGTCKTYTIKADDLCSTISKANTMTVDDINNRNNNTWGWTGCNYLIVGGVICLSTGSPPMPSSLTNALCGPQVPGTQRPTDMSTLADLNPCPLKACCNVWGQCGITKDFCVPSPADTGAPGTATPGSNGCIASCGSNITNNGSPPSSFKRIGYFEAWNGDRPCLHQKVNSSRLLTYCIRAKSC